MKQKKKLVSATLSLIVATVLMSSSSYAWFTISTNPEVSNIKTSITANENIEIALDNGYANAEAVDAAGAVINGLGQSGNPYTWGNLLDLSTAMTNIGGTLSLKPVGFSYDSVTNKVTMKTPEYGLDGRVARLNNMAQQYISAYNAITSPSGGVSVFKPSAEAATADALALSFWLRSNEDVSLKLSEGNFRADDGENASGTVNAEQGLGSTLKIDFSASLSKVKDLDSDLYNQLIELKEDLLLIVEDYDCGDPISAANKESWEQNYRAYTDLAEEMEKTCMIKPEVTFEFVDAGGDTQSHSLSYLNELIHQCTSISTPDIEFFNFVEVFHTDYIPSDQLLNLIKKIKIRFRVSQGGEIRDYYAKIASRSSLTIDEDSMEECGLSSRYSWMCTRGESIAAIGFKPVEVETEDYIAVDFDSGFVNLMLQFYNESDEAYANYLTALGNQKKIEDAISRYDENGIGPIYISLGQSYTDDLDSEISERYIDFLRSTNEQELAEAEKNLPHIDLSANEARKVDVYIYLDGEAVTNADAITMDGIELSINLQFEKIGGATNAMTAASEGGDQSAADDYLEGGSAYGLYLADNSLHLVYGMETYEERQPFAGSTISAVIPFDPERAYVDTPFGPAAGVTSVVVESSFRRARPTSLSHWFYCFTYVSSITGLENINTSRVENMSGTFRLTGQYAGSFIVTGLSSWNTANVTDMSYMFSEAGAFASVFDTGDLSSWNTANVTNMGGMFTYAGVKATTFHIGDISSWNTANVTNMYDMFDGAGKEATTFNIGDISSWNTSNVSDMSFMFVYAGLAAPYSLDLSSWTTKPGCEHGFFNSGVESKVTPPAWR